MREYMEIGSAPAEEMPAQVGDPDYRAKAQAECKRYIERIRQTLGNEPEGAKLSIKSFTHDFGSYLEVVCWYDDAFPESIDYAFRCENESPITW